MAKTSRLQAAKKNNASARSIYSTALKPGEQDHVSLGNFTANLPPKGFAVHIDPDPEPEAIVTQVTKIGTEWQYELVLHIANYGTVTLDAEVWPL
jgi:hypothetical protein